ncbi:MAG: hypothetical protein AAGC44_15655 [Planctomycetota bacterium]
MSDPPAADNSTPPNPFSISTGPAAALLWGAFLGSSWTWVIGMIFPALLLRDYGIWGWVVFAVPNAIGAAAMGFVLRRPEASRRITRNHHTACHNFSVITVAYHLFVVAWLFTKLFGPLATPLLLAAVALCAGFGLRNRNSAMLGVSVVVSLLSWGCFVLAVRGPGAWGLCTSCPPLQGVNRLTLDDLMFFLPCSVLGFLLCPYLDLTFHRARSNTTPGTGMAAFAIGFLGVFLLMIVFSLSYGAQLLPLIEGQADAELPGFWQALLAIHLTAQAGFTITIHARETIEDPKASTPWLMAAGGIAILLGFMAGMTQLPSHAATGGLSWGEAGYRGFLLFYGTVFPAYVWLVMIPTRKPLSRWGRELRTGVYSISCGLAYALAWVSFVMGHSRFILGIFALLIVARIAIELLPKEDDIWAD